MEFYMTKKKIIIYTIIFIISVGLSGLYKYKVANDPALKFNDACKVVINTTCQQYLNKISSEKKYSEILEIKKVRIKENEKLIKYYKNELKNKNLLKIDSATVEKTLMACIDQSSCKQDYFLLKTAEFTIMELVIDSIDVSQLLNHEFYSPKESIKTLNKAKRIVNKNKYITNQTKIIEYLDKELAKIKEQTESH